MGKEGAGTDEIWRHTRGSEQGEASQKQGRVLNGQQRRGTNGEMQKTGEARDRVGIQRQKGREHLEKHGKETETINAAQSESWGH